MLRTLLTALAWAVAAFLACTLVVKAYDHEVVQHVLVTRNGMTLECERVVSPEGRVSYEACSRVP